MTRRSDGFAFVAEIEVMEAAGGSCAIASITTLALELRQYPSSLDLETIRVKQCLPMPYEARGTSATASALENIEQLLSDDVQAHE